MISNFKKSFKEYLKETIFGTLYFLTMICNKGIRAILLYHSVNDKNLFLREMLYLKKNFRFVLPKDLKKEILEAKNNKENIVCLTFDDGELGNYTTALPILEDLGIKATFFITAGLLGKYIDGPFGKRPMMNDQQVHELFYLGHEIGAHTMTHPKLTEIPLAEARKEIFQSKFYLENLIDSPIISFAYPCGAFNETISNLVKEAGFFYGVTTKEALLKNGNINWFKLPRIGIDETIGLLQFKGKVSQALELYEALRGRR